MNARTLLIGLLSSFALTAQLRLGMAAEPAERPEDIRPLLVGLQIPADVAVRTEDDQPTTLRAEMNGQPAVLVFHRGGWCPYCDLQLSELRLIEDELKRMGYRIIAISPDPPAYLKMRNKKEALGYRLLSDSETALIRAFGIGFTYTPAPDKPARVLPVPAIYIVDATGVTQFHYVNPDYRRRVPADLLLAAAKASLSIQD